MVGIAVAMRILAVRRAVGEPRAGEEVREECFEGRHAAADYAYLEFDASVILSVDLLKEVITGW